MPRYCSRLLLLCALMAILGSSVQAQPNADSVRLDSYGDSLPLQARFRVGNLRFQNGGSATFLGFSPNGKVLVTRGRFGRQSIIRFLEVSTGKELRRLAASRGASLVSALSPDAQQLALLEGELGGPNGQSIHIVDASTGNTLHRSHGLKGELDELVFSPDNKMLASGHDQAIYLWETATGRQLRQFGADLTHAYALTFSPDGKLLASRSADRTIRLWDVEGHEIRRWQVKESFDPALVFHPDGKTLAACDRDAAIHLRDISTGQYRRCAVGGESTVWCLSFSPDGRFLGFASASGRDCIGLMNVRTGKVVRRWGEDLSIESIIFSPDSNILAAVEFMYGTIHLYDVASGKEIRPIKDPPFLVHAATLTNADSSLILGGRYGGIRILDAVSGKEIRRLTGPQSEIERLIAPPDGKTLFSISVDKPGLCLWDLTNPGVREPAQKWFDTDYEAVSPNGKMAIRVTTRGQDGWLIHVLDARSDQQLRRISCPQAPSLFRISADSKILAASGLRSVRRWDLMTGKEYPLLEDRQFLAFSDDGTILALRDVPDRKILLYDTGNGKETSWTAQREEPSRSAAFSPDGRMLATGSETGIIQLWEMTTGKERLRLEGHHGEICELAFSRNGKLLVSTGLDGTAVLWELSGQERSKGHQTAELSGAQLDRLWAELASENGRAAYQAILTLASIPAQATPFLKRQLQVVPPVDSARFDRLIARLDDKSFAVREAAMRELDSLGDSLKRPLENLARQKISAEARRRVDQLLANLVALSGDRLRKLRAVETLEKTGTAEAREFLQTLAQGLPDARLTQEARGAAERLAKRGR